MLADFGIMFFCAIIFVAVSGSQQEAGFDFFIVYDASQPASVNWFKKEFPTYRKMFDGYVNFVFSPCQLIKLSNDKKTITCESADPTCLINKLHSCAVAKITTDRQILVDFISCSLQQEASSACKECLKDQKLANAIDACAKQEEGFQLCVANSQNVNRPLPAELVPFFVIPENFYGYSPYMTTDAVCRWVIGATYPPLCPKDL